ncbi:MAG TPA: xanthine dehydrogenase family protein subunit M [Patescibacteria group bacterium]|nr:xanthine dehydrogenase family protein subunit M [Patescibacteria group bacterium]
MKPPPFEYLAPSSLPEALDILSENGDDAKVLAGGQSLVPAMNFRLVEPALLVDLNGLDDLSYVTKEASGEIRIGAMTRQRTIERDSLVEAALPLLSETMPNIAHSQIRNRGTIGGSLVHADPAAELPMIMVALDARFRLRRSASERWISAADFYQGLFSTDLADDEIMVEVAIPPLKANAGTCFVEFARRKGDYALLGVAAILSLDDMGICREARIVYLNAGDMPIVARVAADLINGEKPTPQLFVEAANHAIENEITPMGDIHASVPYLLHLARALTVQALNQAAIRATPLLGK